jgi:hypothetical protein
MKYSASNMPRSKLSFRSVFVQVFIQLCTKHSHNVSYTGTKLATIPRDAQLGRDLRKTMSLAILSLLGRLRSLWPEGRYHFPRKSSLHRADVRLRTRARRTGKGKSTRRSSTAIAVWLEKTMAASRSGRAAAISSPNDFTPSPARDTLPADTLVDGEVVAIVDGRASFNALQHTRPDAPLEFYVFDS